MANPRLATFCVALSVVVFSGCAPAPASKSVRAAPAASPRERPLPIYDEGWKTVLLRDFGVLLPLPEAREWGRVRVDSWWTAKHRPTGSILELKSWRQRELVDASDCERQARLWKPDLERFTPEEIVFRSASAQLAGYPARVVIASRALGIQSEARTLGAVLAFGAALRSCIALRFRTLAKGPSGPEVTAGRLALVADLLIPKIRRREIDERVVPSRRVPRP